jgi:hypothetical protein
MELLPPGVRRALRAAALSLPVLGCGCNTYILWQDARSTNHERLEQESRATSAWIDEAGAFRGLVLEPSADARAKLQRLLPSSPTQRWLLVEPAEFPETFAVLAFPRDDDFASLVWVEHQDGAPAHVELVSYGMPWWRNAALKSLPARWQRYPSLYGPELTLRLRCRVRWSAAPPEEGLLPTKLALRPALSQVQDDDLHPAAKLALTPLTLAVDLPLLPFEIWGVSLWFP